MPQRPFVDTRTDNLKHEFPRTHGDAFAERSTEVTAEKWVDPIKAADYGKVAIHGANQIESQAQVRESDSQRANVTSLADYRQQRL